MELKALHNLTYGMYIVSSEFEGKMNGQIANVSGQVTDKPIRLFVCLNNQNLTTEIIKKRKAFTISVLSEEADMKLIGKFGFKSGKEINKFDEGTDYILTDDKLPIVKNYSIAYMVVDVESELNLGSHTMFIGKLRDCGILSNGKPMTYAYYHLVKGGLTQKNAPTYIDDKIEKERGINNKIKKYKCTICGYIYDPEKGDPDSGIKPGTPFEEIPDDWKCPICGVGKNMFEAVN